MPHELEARLAHRRGTSCSGAVYNTFRDVNPNAGATPMPRSEGGKCGAVLAAEKTLRDLGLDADFDALFVERFGSLKCLELRRKGIPCNDLVGGAAAMLDELI